MRDNKCSGNRLLQHDETDQLTPIFSTVSSTSRLVPFLASLSSLAPLGHFVELGNQHINRTQTISLAPLTENIPYAVVDINRMISRNNHRISHTLQKCSELLLNNSFVPLNTVIFSLKQAEEAFLYMNEGQHT